MLLRIAALILFLIAACYSFGWLVNADALDALGLISLGLASYILSGFDIPAPPAAR